MKCPHCEDGVIHEYGPDRFGFCHIACSGCGWHKFNTTIAHEMAKEEMSMMDVEVFQKVEVEA